MAANQRLLLDSQAYVDSLESKFEEIRGDPDAVRDTVQRVDLMYAQIDTLIQAFAGGPLELLSPVFANQCRAQQRVAPSRGKSVILRNVQR